MVRNVERFEIKPAYTCLSQCFQSRPTSSRPAQWPRERPSPRLGALGFWLRVAHDPERVTAPAPDSQITDAAVSLINETASSAGAHRWPTRNRSASTASG